MKRSWSLLQLDDAVKSSKSLRQVIFKLGLKPAGGNYAQIQKYINENKIDTSHFTGKLWSKGLTGLVKPKIPHEKILVQKRTYQIYKLKLRLFAVGIKAEKCEECGWAQRAQDGRLPLELDHINGVSQDNRLENIRILCPNCHSLKPTHRGRNIKSKHHARVAKW
jgi:hypothetical protein